MPGDDRDGTQRPKCRENGLDDRPGCRPVAAGTSAAPDDTDAVDADEIKGQRTRRRAEPGARPRDPELCPPELSQMRLASIPAESFVVGCDGAELCGGDERPRRRSDGDAFVIHTTEVTQGAYQRCMAAGACDRPAVGFGPQAGFAPYEHCTLPVASVTWSQADAFCRWAGMRLPTQWEWEHAARGPDGRTYPWGESTPDCSLANYAACGGRVHPVGAHARGASPFGVLDLAGNVREWVADPEQSTAAGAQGLRRGIRGGMFTDDGDQLRSSRQTFGDVEATDRGLGMRCVG